MLQQGGDKALVSAITYRQSRLNEVGIQQATEVKFQDITVKLSIQRAVDV